MIKGKFFAILLTFSLISLIPINNFAQKEEKGKEYPDGHSGKVYFPL